mmetsp:Transcript_28963/g.80998  ORF Transcript_28963/g.80998 Transcript_28963/m.80998 type:complete len:202 (-) Transcript_28963:2201-2806(-)
MSSPLQRKSSSPFRWLLTQVSQHSSTCFSRWSEAGQVNTWRSVWALSISLSSRGYPAYLKGASSLPHRANRMHCAFTKRSSRHGRGPSQSTASASSSFPALAVSHSKACCTCMNFSCAPSSLLLSGWYSLASLLYAFLRSASVGGSPPSSSSMALYAASSVIASGSRVSSSRHICRICWRSSTCSAIGHRGKVSTSHRFRK